MGYPRAGLEAGCLYITISIPEQPPYARPSVYSYRTELPDNFNPEAYELHCENDEYPEEFNWGIYWHHAQHNGIWYTVDRRADDKFFTRRNMIQPPHLLKYVIGLVRVLHVPGTDAEAIRNYLDWVAPHMARQMPRTFIWTTSVFVRIQQHIVSHVDVEEDGWEDFELNAFLCEALVFAYSEVLYALGGQLPRPIMESGASVQLVIDETEEEEEQEQMYEKPARSPFMEEYLLRKIGLDLCYNDGSKETSTASSSSI